MLTCVRSFRTNCSPCAQYSGSWAFIEQNYIVVGYTSFICLIQSINQIIYISVSFLFCVPHVFSKDVALEVSVSSLLAFGVSPTTRDQNCFFFNKKETQQDNYSASNY